MSDDMTQQSIHLHERVGRLEQEVHTLNHRANSMDDLPPRVNTVEALIASMQTEGRATRSTVEKMETQIDLLQERQTQGFASIKATIWLVFTVVPVLIGAAYTIWKMTT